MTLDIKIWSDFACPFCYIGETRLNRAINELGIADKVSITYKAFELDPTAPREVRTNTIDRFAKKYGMSAAEAAERVAHISELGNELGLDFNYSDAQYTNTVDAHRLMKLAERRYNPEVAERLNNLLFRAYFTDGKLLSDLKVLTDIADEAGMDADEVQTVLMGDRYLDAVRSDEHEAEAIGVRGVPYFVINGTYAIPGALQVSDFKDALQREMNRASAAEPVRWNRPHICGPDGCLLIYV